MEFKHLADDHLSFRERSPYAPTRRRFLASMLAAGVLAPTALAQSVDRAEEAANARRESEEHERQGMTEPFKGLTTDGNVIPDLYSIAPTHVSTETVRNAAAFFLSTLSDQQIVRIMFPVDDPQWRNWANQNYFAREGVSFRDMTGDQRQAALALMRVSLSPRGFDLTRNIMRLNESLAEIMQTHLTTGEWGYYFTMLGKPSAIDPWGWQFQGPHAIINYFVMGDQVVMTPLFLGSEPTRATGGKYKGLAVLQKEQNDGLALARSLPNQQQKQAVLKFSKAGVNNLTEAFKDNVVLDYAGLRANELDTANRQRLRELIALYVGNLSDGHAAVKMNEVDRHLENTWFAWIGGTAPDSVYYYRIQSPVICIEFDHQQPANLARFHADPNLPTREHIHCVVRTPNGNDYGKDLLRQHYLTYPHDLGQPT